MTIPEAIFKDRIHVNSVVIVLCFVGVLALSSQSAASYSTYILAVLMLARVNQWNDVVGIGYFWTIAALLGYLVLTSFWSEPFVVRELATVSSRALLIFFFTVAFAECQFRGQLSGWLGRALAIVGSLAAGAAIINYFIAMPGDGRLNGLGQLDTSVIAALVYGVVLIFVLEILITERSPVWRFLALVAAIIITMAIFWSDSRNAWVSVFIGTSIYLLSQKIKDPQRLVVGIITIGFLLSVVLAALVLSEDTRDMVLPRGDSFRIDIWLETLDRVVEKSVIFGTGINTNDDILHGDLVMLHPHNLYLSVLLQGGGIALVLFLLVLGQAFVQLRDNYDKRDAKLAMGIFGIALPAYLLDGHELIDKVGSTWFMLWLPIGICLGFAWGAVTKANVSTIDS